MMVLAAETQRGQTGWRQIRLRDMKLTDLMTDTERHRPLLVDVVSATQQPTTARGQKGLLK